MHTHLVHTVLCISAHGVTRDHNSIAAVVYVVESGNDRIRSAGEGVVYEKACLKNNVWVVVQMMEWLQTGYLQEDRRLLGQQEQKTYLQTEDCSAGS